MQDCCFKHRIDIQLENLHAVKYVHPAKPSDSLTVNSLFLLEANTTLSGVHPPLCSCLFPACVTPHLEELLSQLAAQVATESISGCQCQWEVPSAMLAQEDTSSSESSWTVWPLVWHLAVKLHTPSVMFPGVTTLSLSGNPSVVTSNAKMWMSFMCRGGSSTT